MSFKVERPCKAEQEHKDFIGRYNRSRWGRFGPQEVGRKGRTLSRPRDAENRRIFEDELLVTRYLFEYVGHAPNRFIVRASRLPR